MAILRTPNIGEIVVVPLAHPNGAYIRLQGHEKIPVLAKVRSKFGELINVINFFGYIYNVPISHAELINPTLNTQYYVNIINNAHNVMQRFGYRILDNSEFYNIGAGPTYSFFSYLPGYNNNYEIITPPSFSPSKKIVINNELYKENEMFRDNSISIIKINEETLLHVINKSRNEIIFNKDTGELNIKGYAVFMVDSSYTYTKNRDISEYVIFRSNRNYVQIKKSNITYSVGRTSAIDVSARYNIKIVKLKNISTINQKRYLDIIEIIKNELWY